MSSQIEILGALQDETAAIKLGQLAEKLGVKVSQIAAQVNRYVSNGLVSKTGEGEYLLTPEGQAELAKAQKPKVTEEAALVTDYQIFMQKGSLIGIPENVVSMTAEHIWNGGSYQDLKWVWEALGQMNIRADLKKRWWHSWRTFLDQGIPPELEAETTGPEAGKEGKGERVETGTGRKVEEGRSYILVDDTPTYVGKNLGDLFYIDAVDLARIRAGRGARASAAPGPQLSTADDIIKIVNAVRDWSGQGGQEAPKSYMVTQGEEGAIVQEVEPGKPVVLSAPQASKPAATYFVDNEGAVREAKPGEPIVIKQQTAPLSQKTFIVRQTSEGIVAEEHDLGKPIIINNPAPGLNMPPMMPFPVMDGEGKPVLGQDGQPVYANLEPMLKFMGFQGDQRRADERHSALMGLVQTVKENLPDGIQAIREAAAEARGSAKGKESQKPIYECGECHTKFTLEREPVEGENVKCPQCGAEWPKEVVTGP